MDHKHLFQGHSVLKDGAMNRPAPKSSLAAVDSQIHSSLALGTAMQSRLGPSSDPDSPKHDDTKSRPIAAGKE